MSRWFLFVTASSLLAACVPVAAPEAPRPAEDPITLGEPELPGPALCDDERPMLCVGAPAPDWELVDHQPKSERRGQRYGLSQFRGKVMVVALLAGW